MNTMKTLLQLFSLGLVIFLASCNGAYKLGNTASKDDVYSSSTPQSQPQATTPETYTPQEQTNPNIGTDNAERAKDYSEQRTDEDGDTYVTNNYNGDNYSFDNDEDYYYSRRLRRWYEPTFGFGYYSNVYSDLYYWWGPTYYNPGISFSINIGPSYVMPWYWHSCYPYYGYSNYYPWYSSYPYYGYYYPYSAYGWGYNNGYNNGYWNGYHDGYYGNYYGYNNGYYNYYGNDYGNGYYGNGGGYGSNNYYGHRSSGVVNTTSTNGVTGDGSRIDNVRTEPGNFNNNISIDDKRSTNPSTEKVEPVNSQRATGFDKFDTNPSVQTQKGNTQKANSIDVNPNTQVKQVPDVNKPNVVREMPEPQSSPNKYQWDHPTQSPKQNQGDNQIQRDNEYQAPRNNSYDQQSQPRDEQYVTPRQNEQEQPNYQYQPRQNESPKGNWNQMPDNNRQVAPQQKGGKEYEAPRVQPKVEQPRQKEQPSYNPAPQRSNNGNSKQENMQPRSRRP